MLKWVRKIEVKKTKVKKDKVEKLISYLSFGKSGEWRWRKYSELGIFCMENVVKWKETSDTAKNEQLIPMGKKIDHGSWVILESRYPRLEVRNSFFKLKSYFWAF